MAEIREHQIPIYYFASDESAAAVNDLVPFGLVSCEEKFLGSKEKRLRQLPHGEVHCDHPDHSDSCKLRLALLG